MQPHALSLAAPATAPLGRARAADAAPIAIDSSWWMEYFTDTERADLFASAIAEPERVVVPVLTIYEVVKKLAREAGDETATAAPSQVKRGRVDIDLIVALGAAVKGLPMADSLIHATTRRYGAVLWMQDAHFDGLPRVQYFPTWRAPAGPHQASPER